MSLSLIVGEDETVAALMARRPSKWAFAVLAQLNGQTVRFTELRRRTAGISQKTLAATLRALERDGFVSRTIFGTIPPRVDYALTELGADAFRAFSAVEDFMREHWEAVLRAREEFDSGVVIGSAPVLRGRGP